MSTSPSLGQRASTAVGRVGMSLKKQGSIVLSRRSIGGAGNHSSTTSKGSNTHLSNRASVNFGFDKDMPTDNRQARLDNKKYFNVSNIPTEEILREMPFTVKVMKFDPNAPPAMGGRAASFLQRWKKYKAKIAIGGGMLRFELVGKGGKSTVWLFEIGMIQNIAYKRSDAKDFSLRFYQDDRIINVVADSADLAQTWITAILAEARLMLKAFDEVLGELLSPVWKQLMNNKAIDFDFDKKLSPEEQQGLVLGEAETDAAEICLREIVDLTAFVRGEAHPDLCDAYERLAIWLKRNLRHEEAKYWQNAAAEGRKTYHLFSKWEMDRTDNVEKRDFKRTAMDELRSPTGLTNLDNIVDARNMNATQTVGNRKRAIRTQLLGDPQNGVPPSPKRKINVEDLL